MIEEVQFGKLPIGMKFYHTALTTALSGYYIKTFDPIYGPGRGMAYKINDQHQCMMGFWYTDMVWIYRA